MMRIKRSAMQNVGSRVTDSASNNASRTVLGQNRNSVKLDPPTINPGAQRRIIHRGSSAGLKNEKSVHLQINNTGYLNPKNQKARYNKSRLGTPPAPGGAFGLAVKRSTSNDIRPLGNLRGSVSRIRNGF